jgi:hypothetical protein
MEAWDKLTPFLNVEWKGLEAGLSGVKEVDLVRTATCYSCPQFSGEPARILNEETGSSAEELI